MSTAPPPPRESAPGPLRLVTTLGIAGLFSGLAIVLTYEATLPRILENQARALRAAVFEVVPGSTELHPLVLGDEPAADEAAERKGESTAEVYAAYGGDGAFVGWAITGEGPGFQDTISLIFGYDPRERKVIGMQVLESRETPGLGDRIYKDADFVANFRSLSVTPEIAFVRSGAKTAPNEVDAITGATISSRAVVRIVGTAVERWTPRLPEPEDRAPIAPGAPAAGG